NRRQSLGGAPAMAVGVGVGPFALSQHAQGDADIAGNTGPLTGEANVGRTEKSFQYRVRAAQIRRDAPHPQHRNNGDEARYHNRIGNYSKGLPHNEFGEVSSSAYAAFLKAIQTGSPADFENIPLGGPRLQTSPQAGYAMDLEGLDAQAVTAPP